MENEKLKRDVKKLQQDLHDTRQDLEKARQKSDPGSRSSSGENSSERRVGLAEILHSGLIQPMLFQWYICNFSSSCCVQYTQACREPVLLGQPVYLCICPVCSLPIRSNAHLDLTSCKLWLFEIVNLLNLREVPIIVDTFLCTTYSWIVQTCFKSFKPFRNVMLVIKTLIMAFGFFVSCVQEKRALERKISELEEELKVINRQMFSSPLLQKLL